jgi:hypothetical protein
LQYRWGEPGLPLPVAAVRATAPRPPLSAAQQAPPWWLSGEPGQPFDFTGHLRRLCANVVSRCAELQHIDVERLLIGITQARTGRPFGLQARVTPLRFPRGQLTRQRRGVTFQVQRYFLGPTEYLYLVTFCLPRFLDQDFDDKFVTVFHELHHISPAFDGDLRRHEGRYCLHSHSQKRYDERMAGQVRDYLASRPDPAVYDFLRLNFAQLLHRHGAVLGVAVPRPKMVPVGAWGVHSAAASRQRPGE